MLIINILTKNLRNQLIIACYIRIHKYIYLEKPRQVIRNPVTLFFSYFFLIFLENYLVNTDWQRY